nr:phage Gp37/Gp68 family protein [candidate division Zixibacteria bacterium]
MAIKSAIEWTDSTWNPITGCTKISPGCRFCYAERMANRLRAMGQKNYARGFDVVLHDDVLDYPLQWKKAQNIFVNSMSDLFHEQVPVPFIQKIFGVMHRAHWHRFQILTKRSGRLKDLSDLLHWTPNIWMGVSIENSRYKFRIDDLRETKATIKFLSIEPLIGRIGRINLRNVDWVIAGGESGPGARPIRQDWVTEIRDQCLEADVPFFFKQWGGVNKKKNGRILEGRTWDEMPAIMSPAGI